MGLKIKIDRREEGTFTVFLDGPIDSETYIILDKEVEAILSEATRVVIFDMQGVNYISSMGVSAIIKTRQAVEKNKGLFIMVNLQPQVKKVLEIVAALPELSFFAGLDEADEFIKQKQKDQEKNQ